MKSEYTLLRAAKKGGDDEDETRNKTRQEDITLKKREGQAARPK